MRPLSSQQAGRGSVAEMSPPVVWVDGHRVDGGRLHLRADDHGVLVGDGVFETLLVISDISGARVAFAMQRHLDRLRRSADVLHLGCPYSDDQLRAAVRECLAASPDAGLVRITLTSGIGPLSSSRGGGRPSTIVMAGDRRPSHRTGTAVALVPYTRNERAATAGVKTTSYAENVLALRYARERGASEAILTDTQGRVSEGTGSNIFWSDGERLHTPPLDTGCLAGVTRELIMENVDVIETHLPGAALCSVPEAFLASSTRGVQSIGRIDDTDLPIIDGSLTTAAATAIVTLMATDNDP